MASFIGNKNSILFDSLLPARTLEVIIPPAEVAILLGALAVVETVKIPETGVETPAKTKLGANKSERSNIPSPQDSTSL